MMFLIVMFFGCFSHKLCFFRWLEVQIHFESQIVICLLLVGFRGWFLSGLNGHFMPFVMVSSHGFHAISSGFCF